jgi:hypothetical protein
MVVGKPEENRRRRPRRRWKYIKIDFRETGWGGTGWSHLAQDRGQWATEIKLN